MLSQLWNPGHGGWDDGPRARALLVPQGATRGVCQRLHLRPRVSSAERPTRIKQCLKARGGQENNNNKTSVRVTTLAFHLLRGELSPRCPVPCRVSFLRPYSRRCPISNGDRKANSHPGAACSLCPHQSGPSQYPPRAPVPGSSRPDKVSHAHLLARHRMAAEEPTLKKDRPGVARVRRLASERNGRKGTGTKPLGNLK